MKRSKIILAVSSGFLAIAGIAAAKSITLGNIPGFFITYQRSQCGSLPAAPCLKSHFGATCITIMIAPKISPVKTYNTIVYTNKLCTHKLLYQIL